MLFGGVLYRFTDRANEIMGVVIFIQLVYSLSTLTMLVFSLTFVRDHCGVCE